MYHIHDDKRQIDTAERIRLSLTRCLLTKQMSEISVSDLAAESGVSRSTFYRSFDTPVDVLAYACDVRIDTLIKDFTSAQIDDKDSLVLFTLRYLSRDTQLLEAIVNCDRLDIVQKGLENHSDALLESIREELRSEFTEAELDYLRMGLVGLVTNLLVVWISRGKKETPEQMYQLYRKLYQLERELDDPAAFNAHSLPTVSSGGVSR